MPTIRFFLCFIAFFLSNFCFGVTKLNFQKFMNKNRDATEAFMEVAKIINKIKENVILIIPNGEYRVGIQKFRTNGFVYEPQTIFELLNCKNIKIIAEKNVVIKYNDNLRFGSFEKDGSAPTVKKKSVDRATLAEIGAFISLVNCNAISLENLNVHGNNLKMVLGNEFGDLGYQCNHWGLLINNSNNVTIQNCKFNYFGLDGLYIKNDTLINNNFRASHCNFEYNSRQGFSWAGGNGLIFKDCSFSNTGKAAFGSSPSAGVDIEPDNNSVCKNAIFENCIFENNSGVAFVNDASTCSNVSVNNSRFTGFNSWLLYIRSPFFKFSNSIFEGSVSGGCIANTWQEATTFFNCTFKDITKENKKSFGSYNIEINGTKRMLFENCNFYAYNNRICYLSNDGVTNDDEKSKLKNCKFYWFNNKLASRDYCLVIRSFNLENCSFFDNRKLPIDNINFLLTERNVSRGNNQLIATDKSKFLFWTGNYTYKDFTPENAKQ
jgi:Right handed beta helix region